MHNYSEPLRKQTWSQSNDAHRNFHSLRTVSRD